MIGSKERQERLNKEAKQIKENAIEKAIKEGKSKEEAEQVGQRAQAIFKSSSLNEAGIIKPIESANIARRQNISLRTQYKSPAIQKLKLKTLSPQTAGRRFTARKPLSSRRRRTFRRSH